MSPITSSLDASAALDVLSFLAALDEPTQLQRPALRVIEGGLCTVTAEQVVSVSANQTATVTASERIEKHTGSKYVSGRDVAEIAKLVREDIKAFLAARPQYKGTKVAVMIQRSSMSSCLNLRIKALPFSVYTSDELYRLVVQNGSAKYRSECGLLLDELERLGEAYQKSERHSQSDYYNTNFHLSVGVDSDLTNAEVAHFRAQRAQA